MSDKYELSRRKALLGLGTIGVAGAGAGMGTSALFSDEEGYSNNSITAGTLDLVATAKIVGANSEYKAAVGPLDYMRQADGAVEAGFSLKDFKPGDWVIVCLDITVDGNPACVNFSVSDLDNDENTVNDPEGDREAAIDSGNITSPDTPTTADVDGRGELAQNLVAEVYSEYTGDASKVPYAGDPRDNLSGLDSTTLEGATLLDFVDTYSTGVTVGGGGIAYSGTEDWYLLLYLPEEVGNEVQSDSVEWDTTISATQARNNDDCGFESYIGYEDREAGSDFDYNDFGMFADIRETYDGGELQSIHMEFNSEVYKAGDSHLIDIKRSLPGGTTWDYTLSRSGTSVVNTNSVTSAGTGSGQGNLDLTLFDTRPLSNGDSTDHTVTIDVEITGGTAVNPPTPNSARPDIGARNPLFGVYDPVLTNKDQSDNEISITTVQSGVNKGGDWDNDADVPNILVVPDTSFTPPDETETITEATTGGDDYEDFDDYYAGGTAGDGTIEVDPAFEDWFDT